MHLPSSWERCDAKKRLNFLFYLYSDWQGNGRQLQKLRKVINICWKHCIGSPWETASSACAAKLRQCSQNRQISPLEVDKRGLATAKTILFTLLVINQRVLIECGIVLLTLTILHLITFSSLALYQRPSTSCIVQIHFTNFDVPKLCTFTAQGVPGLSVPRLHISSHFLTP